MGSRVIGYVIVDRLPIRKEKNLMINGNDIEDVENLEEPIYSRERESGLSLCLGAM